MFPVLHVCLCVLNWSFCWYWCICWSKKKLRKFEIIKNGQSKEIGNIVYETKTNVMCCRSLLVPLRLSIYDFDYNLSIFYSELFAHSGVQHILCCVFNCLSSSRTLCCQFLWIVHFWFSQIFSIFFYFNKCTNINKTNAIV
jgi:hypothetical protein